MESPPLSYPYGESMSDFYSHRQQLLNYEKSGKPIGYPIFPPMFSFLFPSLSSTTYNSFSFPNLNRQPWQKSGPIRLRLRGLKMPKKLFGDRV